MNEPLSLWTILGVVSYILLWFIVGFLGFLLLGTLRAVGLLRWRIEQLEATTPSRLGRSGLKPGKKAPDFTLPSVQQSQVSLHDFAGRRTLLVFTQDGCGPCRNIMPGLNRLQAKKGDPQILVVNRGDLDATRKLAADVRAEFPVLVEDGLKTAKQYEVFATPFAFLINEKGIIVSRGIVNNQEHIGFVLSDEQDPSKVAPVELDASETEKGNWGDSRSNTNLKEVADA
jgi:methylamine dehydrogenase accessory protein MauD